MKKLERLRAEAQATFKAEHRAFLERELPEAIERLRLYQQAATGPEAEAEAIRIFADALEEDPEFYAFQRSLEAYKVFLTSNTTVVLPANSDLFQFLQSPNGLSGGNGN